MTINLKTLRMSALLAVGILLVCAKGYSQNSSTVTITNYGSIINGAIAGSFGSNQGDVASVYGNVLSAIGGGATFNGVQGNTLTGTGVTGQASATSTVQVTISAGAPGLSGTVTSTEGETVTVSWTPVVQNDGFVHLQITVTVATSTGSYTRVINTVLYGITAAMQVFKILPGVPGAPVPNIGSGSSPTSSTSTVSVWQDPSVVYEGNDDPDTSDDWVGVVVIGPLIPIGPVE